MTAPARSAGRRSSWTGRSSSSGRCSPPATAFEDARRLRPPRRALPGRAARRTARRRDAGRAPRAVDRGPTGGDAGPSRRGLVRDVVDDGATERRDSSLSVVRAGPLGPERLVLGGSVERPAPIAGDGRYHRVMTETEPTIRRATADDAEAIAALFTDEGYPAGPSDIVERLEPVRVRPLAGPRRRAGRRRPRVRRAARAAAVRARRPDRPVARPRRRCRRPGARPRPRAHRRGRAGRRRSSVRRSPRSPPPIIDPRPATCTRPWATTRPSPRTCGRSSDRPAAPAARPGVPAASSSRWRRPTCSTCPWALPLADWDRGRSTPRRRHRFREIPVGPSRHLVRFVVGSGRTYALKEEPLEVARREFDVLRHLEVPRACRRSRRSASPRRRNGTRPSS